MNESQERTAQLRDELAASLRIPLNTEHRIDAIIGILIKARLVFLAESETSRTHYVPRWQRTLSISQEDKK